MQGKRLSIKLMMALAVCAVAALMAGEPAAAQTETVLHSFDTSGKLVGGLEPDAGLIFDADGNLYGTTALGGTECAADDGCGTVFKLTPQAGGGWTETVLHNFNFNGTDGISPRAGLIFDGADNLYGTTLGGGAYADGTVFELKRTAAGRFTERILHSFGKDASDGRSPYAGLVFDAAGNLYGTTSEGGAFSGGTVFELKRTAAGGFTEKIVHSFCSRTGCADGADPLAGLIIDGAGNLYGATYYGGVYGGGTVFELTPSATGGWKETVLHAFGLNGTNDGVSPVASLIFDAAGNLYSTTFGGTGNAGEGTVFELSPTAGGTWTEQILYKFCSETDCADGTGPRGSLIFDASGNLYGTTSAGGAAHDHNGGTAFELTPAAGGIWSLTVLHSFGHGKDGLYPFSGLTFDTSGNLYGTTSQGGFSGGGTAFEVTP